MAGMRMRFDALEPESGVGRVSFHTEDIGHGVGRAAAATRRLLEKENVDLVVGLMNPRAVRFVHDVLEDSKSVFVNVSTGESASSDVHSSIFHISLNGWQAHHTIGEWAHAEMGQRAVIITSFGESGYDLLPAFRRGFELNGGKIVSTHIVDAPAGGLSVERALASAASVRPDVVYALFSEGEAEKFLRAYARSPLAGRVPLVGSASLLEAGSGAAASCVPWTPQLRTPESQAFVDMCRKAGRAASSATLLGYDAAGLIAHGLAKSSGDPRHARFVEGLRGASFESPRGHLVVDARTGGVGSPLYLCNADRILRGMPVDLSLGPVPAVAERTGGWLHPSIAL